MKKVGVITLFRWSNCGTMLQAYATNKLLNSMGYDCELIDYTPPKLDQNRAYKLYDSTIEELEPIRSQYKEKLEERKQSFGRFLKRCKIGSVAYKSDEELYNNPPKYDVYITGGDQIWNVNMRIASDAYFLKFTDSQEKYAFGTSIGRCKEDKLSQYSDAIKLYKKIYIREKSGAQVIRDMTGMNNISTMIDPTLILTKKDWEDVAVSERIVKDNYIMCYATLDDHLELMLPILKKLHKKTGLKIALLGMVTPVWEEWIENVIVSGPEEFIAIVRDSKLVVTHSLHGTVFSIIMNKPFMTYHDEVENLRTEGVLGLFGLQNRIVHSEKDVDCILSEDIDYKRVNEKLEEERALAIKEIKSCLGD